VVALVLTAGRTAVRHSSQRANVAIRIGTIQQENRHETCRSQQAGDRNPPTQVHPPQRAGVAAGSWLALCTVALCPHRRSGGSRRGQGHVRGCGSVVRSMRHQCDRTEILHGPGSVMTSRQDRHGSFTVKPDERMPHHSRFVCESDWPWPAASASLSADGPVRLTGLLLDQHTTDTNDSKWPPAAPPAYSGTSPS